MGRGTDGLCQRRACRGDVAGDVEDELRAVGAHGDRDETGSAGVTGTRQQGGDADQRGMGGEDR